jgi:hypothetical protein
MFLYDETYKKRHHGKYFTHEKEWKFLGQGYKSWNI